MSGPVMPIDVFRDTLGIAGAGLMAYGAWLVFPPAGFLVGGAVLFALAVVSAFTAARQPPPAKPEA